MSAPRVLTVAPGSPAARAGVRPGDELVALDGRVPRDVLEYRWLADDADPLLTVRRDDVELEVPVAKGAGEALGLEVSSAVFDRVQTCDNHCEFCFIYQLPKGMRRSLYLKDDDYRLSFLYGNFTTLTRFTELDLERVLDEGLSPLHVSIHATAPAVRADLLRNRRGGTSLRWLRALLDAGIEVHGQVVVCPGLNDGDVLDQTLVGVLDRFPELASLCLVPLGLSAHTNEPRMRPHTLDEARAVVDLVEGWQETFLAVLGRRVAFLADEYYLLAGRPFPPPEAYEGFAMHEDGIGMARTFELELMGQRQHGTGPQAGFFAAVEGAPADGYRAPRTAPETTAPTTSNASSTSSTSSSPATGGGPVAADGGSAVDPGSVPVTLRPRRPRPGAPLAILTGELGAAVLAPLVDALALPDVRVVAVENRFFGGTTSVTGLLVGEDLARVLADQPEGHRYLLPDVCLSRGTFLDGTTPDDLPKPVEVVPTDGVALRAVLDEHARHLTGAC